MIESHAHEDKVYDKDGMKRKGGLFGDHHHSSRSSITESADVEEFGTI